MSDNRETEVTYRTSVDVASCVCCKRLVFSVIQYRGQERPCCENDSCGLWATSGINFHLLPSGSWDEID